jgi:hypothetical protein
MQYTHHHERIRRHPAGESRKPCLRVDFDRRLKLEFHGSKITSDAGLLSYRELDDALGLTEFAGEVFQDSRAGKNGRHGMTGSSATIYLTTGAEFIGKDRTAVCHHGACALALRPEIVISICAHKSRGTATSAS